jgi:hypothetical protein
MTEAMMPALKEHLKLRSLPIKEFEITDFSLRLALKVKVLKIMLVKNQMGWPVNQVQGDCHHQGLQ